MANEGTITATFSSDRTGSTVSATSKTARFDIGGSNCNSGETQNIDATGEVLTWAEGITIDDSGIAIEHTGLTDAGVATTATLLLSYGTSAYTAAHTIGYLKPGQLFTFFPILPTSQTGIYAKASSGTVKVRKYSVDITA